MNKAVSNKEIAVVFKKAKKYLAKSWPESKNIYICIAINEVMNRNHVLCNSCTAAKTIIAQRLEGSPTVGSWLKDNGFITSSSFTHTNSQNQLQEYRHRWLDSLIKEFSK